MITRNTRDEELKDEFQQEVLEKHQQLISISHSKNLKVHLSLKDNSWRNGFVKEVQPDFFMFEDKMNGVEPIFFLEVHKVEPFIEGGRR